MKPYIIPFEQLKNKDVELVGGKNASIGEMISGLATLGVLRARRVRDDLACVSRTFLAQGGLDERIRGAPGRGLDVDDVERLAVVGRTDPRLDALHAVPQAAARRNSGRLAQNGQGKRRSGRISPLRSVPRRPPKICRRHRSPDSRRLS